MVGDPIGDMLAQIKNASLVGRTSVELPFSKLKMAVAGILAKEGYLTTVEKNEGDGVHTTLKLGLRYHGKHSAITDVKRVSKPGLRVYKDSKHIPTVVGGLGIAVLSTSQGMMSGKDAKMKKLGGEVVCIIW